MDAAAERAGCASWNLLFQVNFNPGWVCIALLPELHVVEFQVALNWNICKGTVPIPGAKTVDQLAEAAGALGWRLTDEEVKALDDASSRVLPFTGAPFENW